jgi:O-antigen ligase
MNRILNLIALFVLSAFIVLRLFFCGNVIGSGVSLFISSLIIIAFIIWLMKGELRIARLGMLGHLLIAWLTVIILSILWAGYKFPAFTNAFQWVADVLLFYLIIQITLSGTHNFPRIAINIFLVAAVIIIFYGLYQYFWGLAELRSRIDFTNIPFELKDEFSSRVNTNEPFGTFTYQNSLGAFLVIVIPIFLSLLIQSITKYNLLLVISHSVLVILSVFILYTTGSKGAWIAFLVSMVIFWIIALWKRMSKKLRLIVPLTFGVIFIITAVWLINTESMQVRFGYWQGALGIIKDNFWLGVGLGNFPNHYTMYKPVWAGETIHAHNGFIEVFTELGIIGFIVFCAIWAVILFKCFKALSKELLDDKNRLFIIGLVSAILGFLIHSLVDFNFSESGLSMSIWLIAGCVIGLIYNESPKIQSIKTNWLVKCLLISGGVIVVIGLEALLIPRIMISDEIIEESHDNPSRDKTKPLLIAKALNPYNIGSYLELACFYHANPFVKQDPNTEEFARWQSFVYDKNLDKAIKLNQNSASLYYLKGKFLEEDESILEVWAKKVKTLEDKVWASRAQEGIRKDIVESYQKAVHYYPTKPEYLYRLGCALEKIDQQQAAKYAYKQALTLSQQVKLNRLKLKEKEIDYILNKVINSQ